MKKSFFRRYIEYLKDNPKKYWFKRRWFGWGWVPVKLEGWIVVLLFIIFLLLNSFILTSKINPSQSDINLFFFNLAFSIIILILICYKTGEKPRWSWGK